ncbi:hypothetical protein [Paenibacillus terrae]|uniref:Uncharacterized protein n=1 Tax=Paenibacillus terrae TaxID=159743 RepID=A0A0D7WZ37_9BACL|nr:hypothetical protein [Paenibacillus terrae]KJD43983.1 hypothetical protein QD47_19435 [Paenibacillus terrae]
MFINLRKGIEAMNNIYRTGEQLEIVSGSIYEIRTIKKIESNGTIILEDNFLSRRTIIPSDHYTTKGYHVGHLGSKSGKNISFRHAKL